MVSVARGVSGTCQVSGTRLEDDLVDRPASALIEEVRVVLGQQPLLRPLPLLEGQRGVGEVGDDDLPGEGGGGRAWEDEAGWHVPERRRRRQVGGDGCPPNEGGRGVHVWEL